ncbi:MAG: pilus assembly protein CpaE [Pseudolysinimonas sp.]
MISTALARELRAAGLVWTPASGDSFQIGLADFEGDVFTVSDMTIEAHQYSTGTVLGFNGTTEWALDSVALDDALWLPREDQLREFLRGTFRSLERSVDARGRSAYTVTIELAGVDHATTDDDAAEAYGRALLALMSAARQ